MTSSQGEMRELYPVTGEAYRYRIEDRECDCTFNREFEAGTGFKPGPTLSIESRETGEGLCRTESGQTYAFAWAWVGLELHVWLDGAPFVFQRAVTRRRSNVRATEAPRDVVAPMPGVVLEVLVRKGDRVEINQTVVVIESMKMELVITPSRSGVVRNVEVHSGQLVERGMRLLEIAPEGDA